MSKRNMLKDKKSLLINNFLLAKSYLRPVGYLPACPHSATGERKVQVQLVCSA